ncbi:Putative DNA topoisomerase, type IIA [Septoria linicola]|uniref:DNA topoisomerase, type IIA n=1 Tax=Septoria linicola TaxID=215465 RepID=A0A9Q9AQC6_9PEZI|nr:putative DNA topoisomerase, type IIA [Septoria linicola]USW53150.1 Putative DNA topoisomerase, type IIA [Septoria linicola]
MAPVVLDYDGDGNVIGGHTVNELPDRRFPAQLRTTMKMQDSTRSEHPGFALMENDQSVERQHQHQPLHSQASEWSVYHQNSLPVAGPTYDHERAHSVQPPPFMHRPEVPPRAARGQPIESMSHVSQQQAHFVRDSGGPAGYSDYQPSNPHGYVRSPVQYHGFHSQNFAPPLQTHPSQVYYEPVGFQRGPEGFAYQHQRPMVPQHHGYLAPQQGYQAAYGALPYSQHHSGPPYHAAYHPATQFQPQQVPYQQQVQQHHHDRRVSGVSKKRSSQQSSPVRPYESPYAPGPEATVQGKQRDKARNKRQPSRVTAGEDELPVVRKASIAGLPIVENVFFKSSRPDITKVSRDEDDEEPPAESTNSISDAAPVVKQTMEKVRPTKSVAKNTRKEQSKKDSSRKSRKKDSAALLGRCADCKKRHKKCKHLSRSNVNPKRGATKTSLLKAVKAGEDTPEDLPAPAATASQAIAPTLDDTQSEVSDADLLALVPDDGARGDSPEGIADGGLDLTTEGEEEVEVRYEEFLRSQSPEDSEAVTGARDINEESPAAAAANLLNKLHAQLHDTDPLALEAFHQDANRYKAAVLDEREFYVRTYKLFRRADASNLMPDFVKCLPHRWDHAQLSWLNDQAELEMAKEDKILGGNVKIIPKEAMPKATRKRRPKAGFRASDSLEVSDSAREEQDEVPDCGPSRSMFVRATPPSSPKSSPMTEAYMGLPGEISENDLEPPVKQSVKKAAKPKPRPTKAVNVRTVKKVSSAAPMASKIKRSTRVKRVQNGHLYASEIEHVGPRYGTRREVLRRSTNPYVHSLCGQGFPHPQEVRAHHRAKKCHDDTSGQDWDEHPSCKADYPELNYTKVRDGYVILDQASWDKLEAAVAAGEREPNRFRGPPKGKELEETTEIEYEDEVDLDDSEDDAEYEVDEEFETAYSVNPYTEEEDNAEPVEMPSAPIAAAVSLAAPAPNPRKRAASGGGGRATKKIVVKAGSDETAMLDATEATAKATSSKRSKMKPAVKATSIVAEGDSAEGLMRRAAALGLRARF